MFPKSKRIVNLELLEEIRQKACLFCLRPGPNDPHHLRSVKSGGNDTEENLISACRVCHTELHKRGLHFMMQKYLQSGKILESKGWKLNHGRMRNENGVSE